MARRPEIIDDAFFAARSKVNDETGCLEWTRHIDRRGYGTLKHKQKHRFAHRMMWEYKFGPIPEGMNICHKCDNPKCLNPNHLFVGTTQDNVSDKMVKGRFKPVTGERNGCAKLTADQIEAIRLDPRPQHVIAKDYGISQSNVSLIKQGKTWIGGGVSEDKRLKLHELAKLFDVDYSKLHHHLMRYKRGFRQSLERCGVSI